MNTARKECKASNFSRTPGVPKGFTLVEVALALGICTFLITALFGLLQASLLQHRTSLEESLAVNLSQMVISDLQQTARDAPPQTTKSLQYELPVTPGSEGEVYLMETGAAAASSESAKFLVKTRVASFDDASGKGRRCAISFWPPHGSANAPIIEFVAALKLP